MKLILIELNEINFDIVEKYISRGESLKSFKKIIDTNLQTTQAENSYDHLEPWIQWPSVHTGLTYRDHNVFRLGDIVNCEADQIFEKVEKAGFRVGSISAMNASNKLQNPSYFIPDPWTLTDSDSSLLSKALSDAISQAVNDNSESRISFKSIISLVIATFALVKITKLPNLAKYAFSSISKPWRKAIFLDMLLHEIHKTLLKRKKPDFSTIFFNAGAHIQHHYFYNSRVLDTHDLDNPDWYISKNHDPLLEVLKAYDKILFDYLNNEGFELIVATGLSQKPFEELKFYYRLTNHESFLNQLGLSNFKVKPRMTRDFLISFESTKDALESEKILKDILVDKSKPLFGEVDNRGKDIFVVLTYPNEVNDDTYFNINNIKYQLKEFVSFVAIKNGEHQSKGFAYYSNNLRNNLPINNSHVSNIHNVIGDYFHI